MPYDNEDDEQAQRRSDRLRDDLGLDADPDDRTGPDDDEVEYTKKKCSANKHGTEPRLLIRKDGTGRGRWILQVIHMGRVYQDLDAGASFLPKANAGKWLLWHYYDKHDHSKRDKIKL